jgi:hypothetical protein
MACMIMSHFFDVQFRRDEKHVGFVEVFEQKGETWWATHDISGKGQINMKTLWLCFWKRCVLGNVQREGVY